MDSKIDCKFKVNCLSITHVGAYLTLMNIQLKDWLNNKIHQNWSSTNIVINFNTADKLHPNFCFPNPWIYIKQSFNTFSFMSAISCSYCLTFSSKVIALASDSCFAVRAVSSLLFTSLMLPSKSSYLDFSVKLPVGRPQKKSLYYFTFFMKIINLHAYMQICGTKSLWGRKEIQSETYLKEVPHLFRNVSYVENLDQHHFCVKLSG